MKSLSLSQYYPLFVWILLTLHTVQHFEASSTFSITSPKSHQLHFQGHVINQAAKAFLFVADTKTLERYDSGLYSVTLQRTEARRRKGPLGKLHTFVLHIQQSG